MWCSLPGKAFVRRGHVWLTRANEADSKIFSRAILAKVLTYTSPWFGFIKIELYLPRWNATILSTCFQFRWAWYIMISSFVFGYLYTFHRLTVFRFCYIFLNIRHPAECSHSGLSFFPINNTFTFKNLMKSSNKLDFCSNTIWCSHLMVLLLCRRWCAFHSWMVSLNLAPQKRFVQNFQPEVN